MTYIPINVIMEINCISHPSQMPWGMQKIYTWVNMPVLNLVKKCMFKEDLVIDSFPFISQNCPLWGQSSKQHLSGHSSSLFRCYNSYFTTLILEHLPYICWVDWLYYLCSLYVGYFPFMFLLVGHVVVQVALRLYFILILLMKHGYD
jgi:hypothetical protein